MQFPSTDVPTQCRCAGFRSAEFGCKGVALAWHNRECPAKTQIVFQRDDRSLDGLAFLCQLVLHVADVSQHLANNDVTFPSSLQLDNKEAGLVSADRKNVDRAGIGWVLLTHPLTVLLEDVVIPPKFRLTPVHNEEVLQVLLHRE